MKPIKAMLINFRSLNTVENMSLLKGSSIILFIKVVTTAIAFISTLLITRYTSSPVDVGNYFFIISILAISSTISRVGFDNVIIRFIALVNKDNNYVQLRLIYQFIMKKICLFSLSGAALIIVIAMSLYLCSLVELNMMVMLCVSGFLIILLNVNVVFVQCYQGIKKIVQYAVFNALSRAVLFVLIVLSVLYYDQLNLTILFFIYSISILISTLFSFLFWRREPCLHVVGDAVAIPTQEILCSARTLWGASVLAIVMSNGAAVVLGIFSDPEQVAQFATANRVALLISFILIAFNGVLSPKFAELSTLGNTESNRIDLQRLYRSSTGVMLIVTLPIFIFTFVYAHWILSAFGDNYTEGKNVLRVIIGAHFIKVLVGSVGQLLVMTGNGKYQRKCLIISTCILITTLILLTPAYGALGAALSVFFAIITNNLLGVVYVYNKLHISLL